MHTLPRVLSTALLTAAALLSSPQAHASVPHPFDALQSRASSLPGQQALKTSLTLSLGQDGQDVRAAITVQRSGPRSSGLCRMQLSLSRETSYIKNGLRIVGKTREAHSEAPCAALATTLTRLASAEMHALATAPASASASAATTQPAPGIALAHAPAPLPTRGLASLTPVKFKPLSARSAKTSAKLKAIAPLTPAKLRSGPGLREEAAVRTMSARLSDRIYRVRAAEHAVLRAAPARSGRKLGRLAAGDERRARLVANAPGWFELLDGTVVSFVHESAVNQSPVIETASADDQQLAFAGGSR
jgi:hypothetical protein